MKFFRPAFLFTLFLCAIQAFSQNSNIIFEEHFTNNANNWAQFDTTWATQKLDSGFYLVERKNEFGNGEMRNITWDATQNFSLECTTKWRSGDKLTTYGIFFGVQDWDNNFAFLINADGNYLCQNFYQGNNYSANWKTTAIINKKGQNKLKVIKFGNWLNYFINDVYVDRIPYQQMLNSNFMLYVGGNQAICFDDVLLKYCDKESYISLFGEAEYNSLTAAYKAGANKTSLDEYITKTDGNIKGATNEYVLLDENFNNNDRLWQTGLRPDTVEQVIKDSAYYCENFNEYGYAAYQKISIHRNSDYSINFSTEWEKGTETKGYGIIWGFKDWDNYKTFMISAAGQYYISPYDQEKSYWKNSNAIVKKGKNLLSVLKKGSVCYFYVNNLLIDSAAATLLDGNTIGLYVADRQKVKFDDVLVKEKLFVPSTSENAVVFSEKFADKQNDKTFRPFYTRAKMKLGQMDDGTETYLGDGRFFFMNSSTFGYTKTAEVLINTDNDFVMEATVKPEKGERGPGYGIIWGFKDWDNTNLFVISTDGAFRCSTIINKIEIFDGWIKCAAIQTAAKNVLKIHKQGTIVQYYINGELVATLPYYEMRGNNQGYVVFGKQTISSDKFEITEEKASLPPFNKGNILLDDQFFNSSILSSASGLPQAGFQLMNGKYMLSDGPDTLATTKTTKALDAKSFDGCKVTFSKVLSDLTTDKKDFRIDCDVQYVHMLSELNSGNAQDSLAKYDLGAGLIFGGKTFLVYRNGNFSTTGKDTATFATRATWIDQLTIEKYKGKIYYYINNMLVDTQTVGEFKNNGLGLVLKAGRVWQYASFDNLMVRYL